MKRVLLAACFAALCSAQQGSLGKTLGSWHMSAAQISSEGHVIHLRGHAEISNVDMAFRAGQIDIDEDKTAIHLTGNVTIDAKGKGTLIADEADYEINSGELRLKLKLAPAR